ncbi:T9SS type A sorting domain-containing protein [Spongiimicrobium sp. 2-473A-2-J]|uniref:T9SS type A sorting domain-containing protein n=1 Tax=Eudoraea algarum TaxID=3417568 RepID=UPI003D36341C
MKKRTILAILVVAFHFAGLSQESGEGNQGTLEQVEAYIYGDHVTRKKSKKTFKLVRSMAETGDADAMCMLGVLHKDGIGTVLDFNQARMCFERAYELGSDKAAYSLGYLYLKGLGDVEQDYAKAMEWFKKGTWPMAKHWLAKMYYFGLGVPKDRARAMDLLRDNPIYNSEVLLQQFQNEGEGKSDTIQVRREGLQQAIGDKGTGESASSMTGTDEKRVPVSIEGNWQGHLLEMDWSGRTVLRTLPMKFLVESTDGGPETLGTEVEVAGNGTYGRAIWKEGALTFLNGQITIEKQYTDHPGYPDLDHDLLSADFTLEELGGTTYLVGRLETWTVQWAEPGPPMVMVLAQGEQELSQAALSALAQQGSSFIKLYPNPFAHDLLVHYELGSDASVEVALYDYYGATKVQTVHNGFLEQGRHTHAISRGDLRSGLYIVQVRVNDRTHTKLVIKK